MNTLGRSSDAAPTEAISSVASAGSITQALGVVIELFPYLDAQFPSSLGAYGALIYLSVYCRPDRERLRTWGICKHQIHRGRRPKAFRGSSRKPSLGPRIVRTHHSSPNLHLCFQERDEKGKGGCFCGGCVFRVSVANQPVWINRRRAECVHVAKTLRHFAHNEIRYCIQ